MPTKLSMKEQMIEPNVSSYLPGNSPINGESKQYCWSTRQAINMNGLHQNSHCDFMVNRSKSSQENDQKEALPLVVLSIQYS